MNAFLQLFGIEPSAGTSVQLWWDIPYLGVYIALTALAFLVAVFLSWRSMRGQRTSHRVTVIGLRVGAIALLAMLLLKPSAILLAPLEGRERLAVVVDGSRSMSISPLGDGPNRLQTAVAALSPDGTLGELGDHYDLEYYSLSDRLTPLGDISVLQALEATGEETDFATALQQLVREGKDLTLGGVLLLSDGIDRGRWRQAYQSGGDSVQALTKSLSGLDMPIHTVSLGDSDSFIDIAIDDLNYNEFAFLRQPTQVTVSVRALGLGGRNTVVKLSQGKKTLGAIQVVLPEDGRAKTVTFPLNPDRVGKYTYTVSTPVLPEEAITGNNTRSFTLKVVRDRVRILQIAGAPSWDEKFLRRLLKTDPNVDLVSFFILRTHLDARLFSETEYSLIEFPYKDLFDKDLGTFDVVIFQNFNYRPYFERDSLRLLSNLANFAREGGGLIVVGGEKAFAGGDYGGTPLESVLPVLSNKSPSALEKQVPFKLSPQAERHPVTALHFDRAENKKLWEQLPVLDGFNPVSVHPDAVVLGYAGDTGMPLLAVRQAGKGRTMAITTDTSWYWSLKSTGEGLGNSAYLRFWKNSLRWVVSDPDEGQVQMDTDRENYRLGQNTMLTVNVVGPDYAPLNEAQVEITVQKNELTVSEFVGTTSEAGEWSQSFQVEDIGAYRVKAVVREKGSLEEVGQASTVFAVNEEGPEMKELGGDQAFMEALAEASGGNYISVNEPLEGPLQVRARPDSSGTQRTVVPLWDKSPGYAGVLCLLCLEWLFRRRWGLK